MDTLYNILDTISSKTSQAECHEQSHDLYWRRIYIFRKSIHRNNKKRLKVYKSPEYVGKFSPYMYSLPLANCDHCGRFPEKTGSTGITETERYTYIHIRTWAKQTPNE